MLHRVAVHYWFSASTVIECRSSTVNEFDDSPFAPVDHVDGFAGTNDVAAFQATDPESGENRVWRVRFDRNLLQSVEPAPDTHVGKL